MAGTDRSKRSTTGFAGHMKDGGLHPGPGPAIILVEPQLGENIGTAARAMLNCGLSDLRLVRPRDGWPNRKAASASAGADVVIEQARLFQTTEAAIADLARVYATTARHRGQGPGRRRQATVREIPLSRPLRGPPDSRGGQAGIDPPPLRPRPARLR